MIWHNANPRFTWASGRGIGGHGKTKRLAKKRAKALGLWWPHAAQVRGLRAMRSFILEPVPIDQAAREYNAAREKLRTEVSQHIAMEARWVRP